MRKNPTDAERQMWLLLKDRRFADFKFRRQVPIGPDSAAVAMRDGFLRDKGFSLIRSFNNQLTTERDAVAEAVLAQLTKLQESSHG